MSVFKISKSNLICILILTTIMLGITACETSKEDNVDGDTTDSQETELEKQDGDMDLEKDKEADTELDPDGDVDGDVDIDGDVDADIAESTELDQDIVENSDTTDIESSESDQDIDKDAEHEADNNAEMDTEMDTDIDIDHEPESETSVCITADCTENLQAPDGYDFIGILDFNIEGEDTGIRIAREPGDGTAVGETYPFDLIRFSICGDNVSYCIEAKADLKYTWGHHNWDETIEATAGDIRYLILLKADLPGNKWDDTIEAFSKTSGESLWGPKNLVNTGCMTLPAGNLNECFMRTRQDIE